jgi:hypothetical protein
MPQADVVGLVRLWGACSYISILWLVSQSVECAPFLHKNDIYPSS